MSTGSGRMKNKVNLDLFLWNFNFNLILSKCKDQILGLSKSESYKLQREQSVSSRNGWEDVQAHSSYELLKTKGASDG